MTKTETPWVIAGRYQIDDLLARGGMAEVYSATDLRLGRKVAIKILRADLARDSSFLARFRREAQAAASLNHPSIVAVYDTGEEIRPDSPDGVALPYLVMEFVDGTTVRDLLKRGKRLIPERALEITIGVLDALSYSHKHGIIHRDIKPGNVMITRQGDIKVMDFGIARALADTSATMTSSQTIMGTAQYISPEQAKGGLVDARSDLYSTGVLLYELLTARPPFTGDSPVSIAYQHVSEPPTPPSQIESQVPPAMDLVVMKSLNKDATLRYQTAEDFMRDVRTAARNASNLRPHPRLQVDTARIQMVNNSRNVGGGGGSRLGRPLVWVLLGAASIMVAAASIWLVSSLFQFADTSPTVVPDINGLTVSAASDLLRESGLVLGQQSVQFSERPSDTIISQNPTAGVTLQSGASVDVVISGGRETIVVPPLVGLTSSEDAQQELRALGLSLGTLTEVESEQPSGVVVATDPPAGTEVQLGSVVNIEVSKGTKSVPELVGLTEAQARSDLINAGFVVNVVTQKDAVAPPGTVLAQTPRAGKKVAPGSLVTLTVAITSAAPVPNPSQPVPTPEPAPAPVPTP
jgi:serine/threonine-protein kinase